MAILCVDAGTSVIKTVAFDERDGRELAAARHPTEVRRPRSGHSEQDMDAVWDAVARTLGAARASVAQDIRAIAITGQGDGCWLVDRAGRPTGPAILWNDGRAADVVEAWASAGVLERAFRLNGSLTFPGLPNAILTWLRRHAPQRLAAAHKALYCNGWIFSKLTGEFVAEDSDASAPFYDIRARRYSAELLDLFDLQWAADLLPEVRPDGGRTAPLSRAAAAELGIPAGVPVVIGPYDIASTAIGAGAVRPGQACSILGTTLCTEVVTDAPDLTGEPAGLTIAFAPGRYLRAFPTLAGCEVIHWAQRLLGLDGPEDLSRLADGVEPGAAGLCFLPYLSPAGERAPFFNPAARGALLGLTFEHDRRHIARALLDGLTFVIRDCFEAAPKAAPADLRVCGGGANSSLWCQTIADVTGVPTLRSADAEAGARGAFLAALVATGAEPDYEPAARSRVKIKDAFEPDRRRSAQYRELYAQFLAVRNTTAPAWRTMAAVANPPAVSHA